MVELNSDPQNNAASTTPMPLFKDRLKLYYFREKDHVSLSILSSPYHVLTFYLPRDIFEKMIADQPDRREYDSDDFLVQRKRGYVRFTCKHAGVNQDLRIETEKWNALAADFYMKLATPSNEPHFACVVP